MAQRRKNPKWCRFISDKHICWDWANRIESCEDCGYNYIERKEDAICKG